MVFRPETRVGNLRRTGRPVVCAIGNRRGSRPGILSTVMRVLSALLITLGALGPSTAAAQEMPAPAGAEHVAPMNPYTSTISYPLAQDMLMISVLPDFQSARSGRNFVTGMVMLQYGLTSQWTVGLMVEGQKIGGLPTTYGGLRVNTYVRLFPHDDVLHLTLYGEYEGLNGAALYKMEVAGFGGEDLEGPLDEARRTPVRTFEQRAIMYHDWGRVNLTFNFVSETNLDSHDNDFGYTWGVFRQPRWTGMTSVAMAAMPGMSASDAPPLLSLQRLGYGVEMLGALGDTHQFGFHKDNQQHYIGPVFTYAVSPHWSVTLQPAFGLSAVSDPFVLRMGLGTSIEHAVSRLAHSF